MVAPARVKPFFPARASARVTLAAVIFKHKYVADGEWKLLLKPFFNSRSDYIRVSSVIAGYYTFPAKRQKLPIPSQHFGMGK